MTALVPYRVQSAPAAEKGFDRVVVTVGGESAATADSVRCAEVVVRIPYATPAPDGHPVGYRVMAAPVRGRTRRRQWEVAAIMNDPAAARFACVPAEPATFDGTWDIVFTFDLDRPLSGTTEITERTDDGSGGAFAVRTTTQEIDCP